MQNVLQSEINNFKRENNYMNNIKCKRKEKI